jgi:ABC-2 type transport system ATP-binding protein
MALIETSDLRKSFRSRRTNIEAVKGVSMQVQEGEIFGFLGPNGAGKTTTMRMLTTLLEPSGGSATVVGHDLLREPGQVRKHIGYVSQAGGADRSATAREDLVLQARLYGMNKTEANKRASELLAVLELTSFADRVAGTYSGGQRRRLDLAMGMIHQPRLLFLDEPTTGLDPQGRARLWDEIRKLRASGTTIFLTTHYLDEADALCNRLAIIDNGQIVVEGTPDMLKRQVAGDVVTLGLEERDDALHRAQELLRIQSYVRELQIDQGKLRLYVERGEEVLPAILHVLEDAGFVVQTIALARPTLDDVFLRQTGRSLRETV